MSDVDPITLGSALDEVVRGLGPGASRSTLGGVFGGWDELVGPAIAAHAQPKSLDHGRLVVQVDQPGWATQLRFLQHDLLAKFAAIVGPDAVTSIEVVVARPTR